MPALRRVLLPLFGWILSILLVVGLLRSAPVSTIWAAIRLVDPRFVLGAMFCASIALVLRGLRWAALFSERPDVPRRSITALTFMGLAINAVLPGRVGDLARATLAARKHGLGLGYTTTTVVLERLVDGLTLLLFLGLSLWSLPHVPVERSVEILGVSASGATLGTALRSLTIACLGLTAMVALVAFPPTRVLVLAVVRWIPILGATLAQKLESFFGEIHRGLRSAGKPAVLLPLLVYSALTWLALTGCNYLVARGLPGMELGFRGALVVTAVAIAIAAVPSAPGAWGVFEAGALLSLAFLGIRHDEATGVAYVFTAHFSQYLPVVAFGIGAALFEHVSWGELRRLRRRADTQRSATDTRRSETESGESEGTSRS